MNKSEIAIINRITLLESRQRDNGNIVKKLKRQLAILRGKKKPTYTHHVDTGDFVIVINAEKVVLTGNKLDDKMYRHHSHYLGGLKEMTYRELFAKKPTMPVYHAVKGMLPKNSLGRKMLTKLKVFAGPEHNHQAQKPELWQF